jgi:hypothetical protein
MPGPLDGRVDGDRTADGSLGAHGSHGQRSNSNHSYRESQELVRLGAQGAEQQRAPTQSDFDEGYSADV